MPSRRFAAVTTAPPDPILGLSEAFRNDPRPGKINLSVGVYQDEAGETPVLGSVREAERRLLEGERTKSYKPITGDPQLADAVQRVVLGRITRSPTRVGSSPRTPPAAPAGSASSATFSRTTPSASRSG